MEKMIKDFIGVIKEMDDEARTLTVLISTPGMDRMEEIVDPMGVDLTNYKANPVVLWAHKYDQPPIAKSLWVKQTKDGIMAKPQFANTQMANEIYDLYKGGFLNCWSVGFLPKKWEDGQKEGEPRRRYTECELLEYSAVPIPANPQALTQIRALTTDTAYTWVAKELGETPAPEPPAIEPATEEMKQAVESLPKVQADLDTANETIEQLQAERDTWQTKANGYEAAIAVLKEELKKKTETTTPPAGISAEEAQAIIESAMAGALTKEINRVMGKV